MNTPDELPIICINGLFRGGFNSPCTIRDEIPGYGGEKIKMHENGRAEWLTYYIMCEGYNGDEKGQSHLTANLRQITLIRARSLAFELLGYI